ncbi:MAG: DsbA family protein [Deltaproteobacteria bacterium]|nr:DsbA family protein [Deltaproteobacteria bacterium]
MFKNLIVFSAVISVFALFNGEVKAEVPWKKLVGCDSSKLTDSSKRRITGLLEKLTNYHGCPFSVAKCLSKGKNKTALHAAGMICSLVIEGKSDSYINAAYKKRARTMHPFRKNNFNHRRTLCTGDPEKAKVVIDVFSDFMCPYCRKVLPLVSKLPALRSNVVVCFRHYPTLAHGKNSILSSLGAEAAANQGKFWKFHDRLYGDQKSRSISDLVELAESMGLDKGKFSKDISSRITRKVVSRDKKEGLGAQVKGTPTIFIAGKMYLLSNTQKMFLSVLDEAMMLANGGK